MSDDSTSALSSKRPIRILHAGNHVLFRDLLNERFTSTAGIEVVGSTGLGNWLVQLISQLRPDVTLVSVKLGLSGSSGMGLISSIRSVSPDTRLITMSESYLPGQISILSQQGVNGFLLESQDWETLLRSIVAVHGGDFFTSPAIARIALGGNLVSEDALSVAEVELMELVTLGLSNDDIATRLNVSLSTVRSRLSNVLVKLNVTNRTQAVTESIRRGYVTLG